MLYDLNVYLVLCLGCTHRRADSVQYVNSVTVIIMCQVELFPQLICSFYPIAYVNLWHGVISIVWLIFYYS